MGEKVLEVVIGRVDVGGGGPVTTPTPGPAPTPATIEAFIEEHRKLKKILSDYGVKGMCVPRSVLERESGITGKRLDQHLRVFEGSDAAIPITEEGEEVICGKSAIEELKKKIKVELGE
ncbi:hypothetical protein J7J18_01375 [bacterium]|nr:hypothetical protein [bacterium]